MRYSKYVLTCRYLCLVNTVDSLKGALLLSFIQLILGACWPLLGGCLDILLLYFYLEDHTDPFK